MSSALRLWDVNLALEAVYIDTDGMQVARGDA